MRKWLITGVVLGALLIGAYQGRLYLYALIYQPQMLRAPVLNEVAPQLPADLGEVPLLGFSKTNGFRHHDSITASRAMLDELAAEHGWRFYHTENGAVFDDALLARFELIVLNHKSGTAWTTAQRSALRRYIEQGGTVVALHAAGGDNAYDWDWYRDELLRAQFVDHPMQQHIQRATLNIEDRAHPATAHLDANWVRDDEWYNFAASPRARVHVLVSIDEGTYDPEKSPMGADHPMVWWHEIGQGRVLYNAMGHTVATYEEPDYRRFVAGAIRWGLGEGAD